MEIPSPQAGVVKSVAVKVGDKVKEGSVILQVEMQGAGADGVKDKPAAAESKTAAAEPSKQQDPPAQEGKAASKAQQGGERVTIVVPDIGDANEVEVIEIMVEVGDRSEEHTSELQTLMR